MAKCGFFFSVTRRLCRRRELAQAFVVGFFVELVEAKVLAHEALALTRNAPDLRCRKALLFERSDGMKSVR